MARQWGGQPKAGALQGRQRSIAEIKPQRMSIFYLSLVLLFVLKKAGVRKTAPPKKNYIYEIKLIIMAWRKIRICRVCCNIKII